MPVMQKGSVKQLVNFKKKYNLTKSMAELPKKHCIDLNKTINLAKKEHKPTKNHNQSYSFSSL